MPSPPRLASVREMSSCQIDGRLEAGQSNPGGGQQVVGYREMAQGGTESEQELNIKLLMTSKVSFSI